MIKYCSLIFLLILTLFHVAHAADNISGNFDIVSKSESETTEGERDKSRSLTQNYNLDLRKDITSKIYFTTHVGANMTDTDDTETTQLFPQLRLNIANNYFNANVGYLFHEKGIDMFGISPSDETRFTTNTWTYNFSTKSVKYPNIRFHCDEKRDYDHLSAHKTDSLSKYYELIGDYTYKFVTVTLRHTKDTNDDYVDNTDDTTTVNEGRLNFRKSFWENRVTTSGIYTVTDTESENVASTVTTSTDETRKELIFDAGLKLRPFNWSRISYDYELNDRDTDTDTDAETDTDTGQDQTVHAHTISLRGDASLHKYLKSWAEYRKRLEYDSVGDDTSIDYFNLNFDYTPIETLNTNFIFSHIINKTESETRSKVSSMLLHMISNIWEGVDLSVDGEINYTDNIFVGAETLAKSIDSDLRLKLTKRLTTEINYITQWQNSEYSDGRQVSTFNYTIRTDIYYRPIQSFYFKFTYELQRNENDKDLNYYITDINWLITKKLRFNLQYKMDKNSHDDTEFLSDLIWDMSKIFVLRFKYEWRREENNTCTKTKIFTTTVSAKF